jgi:catechol 2,3-dioxygenase-like lactoylglutathione lyase family enzyme
MPSTLVAVDFDAHRPAEMAQFWGALLGRPVQERAGGLLLPSDATQVGLRFVASSTEKVAPNQIHLHLTSTDPADQRLVVEAALGLGASHLDVGQLPEEGHVVMADPEGNELCVIPPDSTFLAGCGFLGELACDGTREVGVFWSEVLGWPLVWDRDEETAVQSPAGGTKVAWGGPPLAPKPARNRQRLLLATDAAGASDDSDDHETEVIRLLSLGATRLDDWDHSGREGGGTTLADPDGNELRLLP